LGQIVAETVSYQNQKMGDWPVDEAISAAVLSKNGLSVGEG
jgi:hypothetical protein